MNKVNLKKIALALIIGLVVSLLTLAYAQQPVTDIKYNDCTGLCGAWSSMEVVTIRRGFPLVAVKIFSFGEIQMDAVGLLGNWIIYSAIAYIPVRLYHRRSKTE